MLEAIRATPDRLDNLVYADWLLQRGGVRGELIGQSVQLEREPDNPLLAQRVAALASEAETTLPAGVTVTWKRGFVSKASVTADPEHLVAALQHPLLQLVEELSVGAPEAPLRRNGGTHYSDALLDCEWSLRSA